MNNLYAETCLCYLVLFVIPIITPHTLLLLSLDRTFKLGQWLLKNIFSSFLALSEGEGWYTLEEQNDMSVVFSLAGSEAL